MSLLLALLISAADAGGYPRETQANRRDVDQFAVHEWGTFTAVAASAGQTVQWRPLLGPSDLPDFVYSYDHPQDGLREPLTSAQTKGTQARVRMETPVLYFYVPEPMLVSAKVGFPEGQITEWYPRAASVGEDGIDWGTFRVVPDTQVTLPNDGTKSHYYPARIADADPVQVCSGEALEHEGFLFYRGIGDFELSLGVTLDDRELTLTHAAPVPVMIFEREGDKVGFSLTDGQSIVQRPALDDNMHLVLTALYGVLIQQGLYEKEAAAMIETWKDQWFEEGLRAFYPLPAAETEAILPLTLDPRPAELVRVLVGRLEIITPQNEADVLAILATDAADVEVLTLLQRDHGRFAEPILASLAPESPRAERILAKVRSR